MTNSNIYYRILGQNSEAKEKEKFPRPPPLILTTLNALVSVFLACSLLFGPLLPLHINS